MHLFLVRHGEAVSAAIDPARSLSEPGRAEVAKVAGRLKRLGIKIAEIRCSTKTRAQQTAQIIAAKIAPGLEPVQMPGLQPNDPVEPVARELEGETRDMMLVGHLPFLPELAARLLGGTEPLSFPTAGVAALVRDDAGIWSVEFQLWPEQIED